MTTICAVLAVDYVKPRLAMLMSRFQKHLMPCVSKCLVGIEAILQGVFCLEHVITDESTSQSFFNSLTEACTILLLSHVGMQ